MDATSTSDEPRLEQISLIGYRGTGKSTVARILAQRLGWDWLDADEELERRAGRTIREIFERGGESEFREREAETVAILAERQRAVVAWGGGVILRESNRRALRRGWVIWLAADPQTIRARINADVTTALRRPNLTAAGGEAEIRQLLAAREPLYRECADCTVSTCGKTPDQVASEIVCFLQHRLTPLRSDNSCSDPT